MRVHIVPSRASYVVRAGCLEQLLPGRLYIVPCWLAADHHRRGIAAVISYPF